jgi:hypothetical protein
MSLPLPRRHQRGFASTQAQEISALYNGSLYAPLTSAFPNFLVGRLPQLTLRGLLSIHSRYDLRTRGPSAGPLDQGLKTFRSLRAFLDCYQLEWELPGGHFSPLRMCTFPRWHLSTTHKKHYNQNMGYSGLITTLPIKG